MGPTVHRLSQTGRLHTERQGHSEEGVDDATPVRIHLPEFQSDAVLATLSAGVAFDEVLALGVASALALT